MKELLLILKPLRKKLMMEVWVKWLIRMESGSLFFIFLLFLFSKWNRISNLSFICILLLAVGFVVSLIITFFWDRVTFDKAARIGDSLGLEERLTTAYELLKQEKEKNAMEMLAIQDALEQGRKAPIQKAYSFHISKKLAGICAILVLACCIVGFIPNPGTQIEELLTNELKKVEEIQKELKEEKEISKEELKELNKELADLMKKIKLSKTKGDAIKAVQETQQELKKLEKQSIAQEMKKTGETFNQNQNTNRLGEALKNGDASSAEQALQNLSEKMQELSQEEQNKILELLKKAAEEAEGEWAEALQEFAEALAQEDTGTQGTASNQLMQAIKKSASKNASLRQGIQDLNQTMAQMSQQLQGQSSSEKNNASSQNGGQGEQGQGQSQEEQSQQQGQGQGQENGQGQGQGQGESQSNGQGQGQNQGQGRGRGHVETEKIFTRQAQNKMGYDTKIEGEENQGGDVEQSIQKSVGTAGQAIPYDAVYSEYHQEALRQMEQIDIPYGMKSLVEEYFSTLEK